MINSSSSELHVGRQNTNKNLPRVSIVVPVKGYNDFLSECLQACARLDYPDVEVLVLPDSPFSADSLGIKIIPTGPMPPSAKRDMALPHCRGDIVAFLDDDTFPEPDWLRNAVKYFEDERVAAVGGPAVTPKSDGLMQRASGLVYSSFLGGGNLAYRYVPQALREVDDYPTCNLLVRRSVLEELGGFDTIFWPGEDTKLCLEIVRDLGKKIIYAPDVLVYHHRRSLFRPHLRQIRSYALHRGYFVKRFPATSLRLTYFLFTFLVFGIVAGLVLSVLYPPFAVVYGIGLGVYVAAVLLDGLVSGGLKMAPLVALGTVLTHLTYGVWFVIGLISRRLKDEGDN